MFRSEAQRARACTALCERAGLFGMWTSSGPSDEATALFEAGGGPLSSGERVVLLAAWAFWNSAETVPLADVIYRLDEKNTCAIATLMIAVVQGGHAIDAWIVAMESGAGASAGQVRRPSLRAGRLSSVGRGPR